MSDEELDFNFMIAEGLGATHTTLELVEDEAVLKRLGDWGAKKKIYVAYHASAGQHDRVRQGICRVERQHGQHRSRPLRGGWQRQSGRVHAEVQQADLERPPEGPHHAEELLAEPGLGHRRDAAQGHSADHTEEQVDFPGTIELEYAIPDGSDAVKEVAKCVQYCRAALA